MKILVSAEPGQVRVVLDGDIREGIESDFAKVRDKLTAARVVFDCYKIGHINSIGMRAWAEVMKALKASAQIEYTRCSVMMLEACAMVPGFHADAAIGSFFPELRCAGCNKTVEREVLRDAGDFDRNCARCAARMTFKFDLGDVLPLLEDSGWSKATIALLEAR